MKMKISNSFLVFLFAISAVLGSESWYSPIDKSWSMEGYSTVKKDVYSSYATIQDVLVCEFSGIINYFVKEIAGVSLDLPQLERKNGQRYLKYEILEKNKELTERLGKMLLYCDDKNSDYVNALKHRLHDKQLAHLFHNLYPSLSVDDIHALLTSFDEHRIRKGIGLINSHLEKIRIFDTFVGKNFMDLVGTDGFKTYDLPRNFGKVFKAFFMEYLNSMSVIFKRRMLAYALLGGVSDREDYDNKGIVANSFLGAGPIMQKQLQLLGQTMYNREYVQLFAKLKSNVPPMLQEDLKKMFRDLPELESEFEWFDKNSIASGTIGQIHKGHLKSGEQVAVKLLKSDALKNIDIENDFIETLFKSDKFRENVKLNSKTWKSTDRGYVEVNENVDEMIGFGLREYRETYEDFKNEFNFEQEVKYTKMGDKYYTKKKLGIFVPKVLKEFKNSQGTTIAFATEWIDGQTIDAFLKTGDEEGKCWYLRTIKKFYNEYRIRAYILNGFYHADIHKGNMMIKKTDGKYQLYLIDFGNAGVISSKQRMQFLRLLNTARSGNLKKYMKKFKKISAESSKVPVDDEQWNKFSKDLEELKPKLDENYKKYYLERKKNINENKNNTAYDKFRYKKWDKYLIIPTLKATEYLTASLMLALKYDIPLPRAFVGLSRGNRFLSAEVYSAYSQFRNCNIDRNQDSLFEHVKRNWLNISWKWTKTHLFRLG